MTGEEKAEEYAQNCKYVETDYFVNKIAKIKAIFLDGLAEGEKIGKEKQWIATEKAQKKTSAKIKELEKENAELKIDIEIADSQRQLAEKENEELKAKYESYLRSHTITCGMTGEEIIEMRKENAELKEDLQTAISANQQWLKRDTRLEEQIEKMENCWNCKFFKEKKYQACIDRKKNNTKCCAFYKWELAE